MEHVAERRHREVIWLDLTVAGAERTPDRAAGVQALAATAGLACRTVTIPIGNPDKLLEIAGWVDAAHACFSAHLQAEAPPTAVIAYNELCALGAYAALAEAGLRVPEDVSVIGFDDITADVALPPMTVVSLQLREVGLAAAALALALASGAGAWQRLAGQIVSVPAQLVVRSSTGLAARKRTGRGRAVP
jgi:DNA-binding LacI/PurR family transcriptional regulator